MGLNKAGEVLWGPSVQQAAEFQKELVKLTRLHKGPAGAPALRRGVRDMISRLQPGDSQDNMRHVAPGGTTAMGQDEQDGCG